MIAAENKAVFLSYASQDAEAVRRIAEALRAAGVEVWFDQNELVGGDAWDAKIRRQIKECALFVPVISAATQARLEGYFRLEWKLAAQRTHTMAEEKAFLLPVVIDATRDAEAKVPEEFKGVQWTKLSGGETPAAFCARVNALLERGTGVPPVFRNHGRDAHATSARVDRPQRVRLWWMAVGAAALAAAVLGVVLKPRKSTPGGAAAPTAAINEKSLVVLPFENRSPDPANAFFADGVHEDVLANLSKVRELTVVPRFIAMRYRGSTQRPRDLGGELGVASLVTGTVQRVERKVRVTLQLIDTRTEAAPWTWQQDYELRDADVMAIQTEMATAIAAKLRVVLSPQEEKLIARRPTQSVEAYDAYLKLRANRILVADVSLGLLREGEELARKAVKLDAEFAEGWAELARIHSDFFHFGLDQRPARAVEANAAIDTARRLASDSPEVILVYGEIRYRLHRDYAGAIEAYQRVIQLQPGQPEVYNNLAVVQRRQGKWREAMATSRKVVELDPKFLPGWVDLGNGALYGRRYEEALAANRRMVELAPTTASRGWLTVNSLLAGRSADEFKAWRAALTPAEANTEVIAGARFAGAVLLGEHDEVLRFGSFEFAEDVTTSVAWALAAKGDLPAARAGLVPALEKVRRRLEAAPEHASLWSQLSLMEAVLGHAEEARRAAQKAVDLMPVSRDAIDGPGFAHHLAVVRAWTGDKEGAIAELARLLQVPGTSIVQNYPVTVHLMRRDPRYLPLWGDPRWEAMLADPKNDAPLF